MSDKIKVNDIVYTVDKERIVDVHNSMHANMDIGFQWGGMCTPGKAKKYVVTKRIVKAINDTDIHCEDGSWPEMAYVYTDPVSAIGICDGRNEALAEAAQCDKEAKEADKKLDERMRKVFREEIGQATSNAPTRPGHFRNGFVYCPCSLATKDSKGQPSMDGTDDYMTPDKEPWHKRLSEAMPEGWREMLMFFAVTFMAGAIVYWLWLLYTIG